MTTLNELSGFDQNGNGPKVRRMATQSRGHGTQDKESPSCETIDVAPLEDPRP